MEDIVVDSYDKLFKDAEDEYDPETKVKVRGFHDYEVIDNWKNVMSHTLKRRLARQKNQSKDKQYFDAQK